MSVDMTKWQEIAKKNIHNRMAANGRAQWLSLQI